MGWNTNARQAPPRVPQGLAQTAQQTGQAGQGLLSNQTPTTPTPGMGNQFGETQVPVKPPPGGPTPPQPGVTPPPVAKPTQLEDAMNAHIQQPPPGGSGGGPYDIAQPPPGYPPAPPVTPPVTPPPVTPPPVRPGGGQTTSPEQLAKWGGVDMNAILRKQGGFSRAPGYGTAAPDPVVAPPAADPGVDVSGGVVTPPTNPGIVFGDRNNNKNTGTLQKYFQDYANRGNVRMGNPNSQDTGAIRDYFNKNRTDTPQLTRSWGAGMRV